MAQGVKPKCYRNEIRTRILPHIFRLMQLYERSAAIEINFYTNSYLASGFFFRSTSQTFDNIFLIYQKQCQYVFYYAAAGTNLF